MKYIFTICFIALFSTIGFTQTTTIKGYIKDAASGTALPGVTVIEKGTSNGTTSDNNGAFSINLKNTR